MKRLTMLQNITTHGRDARVNGGGVYTTSKGNFVTGSEGCFTIVGGNECTNELQNDINMRQQNLTKANEPNNILIEVVPRDNAPKSVEVKTTTP